MKNGTIRSIEEVRAFLEKAKKLAASPEHTHINNHLWANGKVNKTRHYMMEAGISSGTIRSVIQELQVRHYCATKEDVNPYFSGEYIWEFGMNKILTDEKTDFYIKLKIRKIRDEELLILSFHPEQPRREKDKLVFPYRDYIEEQRGA